MTDKEKVIKGLDSCAKWMGENDGDACDNCPYHHSHFSYDDNNCCAVLYNDAIALLKEHEAVEPRRIDGKRNHFIKCGNCNCDLMTGYQFCPRCGRAVK